MGCAWTAPVQAPQTGTGFDVANLDRTVGPLMNLPECYQAFGCQEGTKMMRAQADRAKIR